MREISLRKFPYPYHAMLSICSDIDSTDIGSFMQIHRYINSYLGLEMGDSFWMYMAEGAPEKAFSYFRSHRGDEASEADAIRTLYHSGYIDCMHSYGNFSAVGGFERSLAEKAIEKLERTGIRVQVWINHGDAHNAQNVRIGLGDVPGQKEYHTDLTLKYGIRFIWEGELTSFVGQDRPLKLSETYFTEAIRRSPLSFLKNLAKVLAKALVFRPILTHEYNNLLGVSELRDGRKVYAFKRFGFWDKARSEDLAELISEDTLTELMRNKGYMVVYIHLGKKNGAGVFTRQVQWALEELKRLHEAGEILVTTASRLLTYNATQRFLRWKTAAHWGFEDILIQGIESEVEKRQNLCADELRGITFYTTRPEKTRVFSGDKLLDTVINPPDYTGKRSISVPWASLKPPEILHKEGAFG